MSSGMLQHVVWYILTNVSQGLTAPIISVMSLLKHQSISTRLHGTSEDGCVHTGYHENLKSP
jgi:hypothetical protein